MIYIAECLPRGQATRSLVWWVCPKPALHARTRGCYSQDSIQDSSSKISMARPQPLQTPFATPFLAVEPSG